MKKFFAVLIFLVLFSACSAKITDTEQTSTPMPSETEEPISNPTFPLNDTEIAVVLKVGASIIPHAEILRAALPYLKTDGIALEIIEYNDYEQPNTDLATWKLDANFFQHKQFLDEYNSENGGILTSIASVLYEPLAIFPARVAALDAVEIGMTIAIPADDANRARALLLLQSAGFIVLKDGGTLQSQIADVLDNPKLLNFYEYTPDTLNDALAKSDVAVINGNVALQADMTIGLDSLFIENADAAVLSAYANVLAIRVGDDRPELQKLADVLTSQPIKDFISNTYNGEALPVVDG